MSETIRPGEVRTVKDLLAYARQREASEKERIDYERRKMTHRGVAAIEKTMPEKFWDQYVDLDEAVTERGVTYVIGGFVVEGETYALQVSCYHKAGGEKIEVTLPEYVSVYLEPGNIPRNVEKLAEGMASALRRSAEKRKVRHKGNYDAFVRRLAILGCDYAEIRRQVESNLASDYISEIQYANLMSKIESDEARWEKALSRRREVAAELLKVADESDLQWERYFERCREWAENETAFVFAPWSAWEVRYVPKLDPYNSSDFLSPELDFAYLAKSVLASKDSPDEHGVYTVIDRNGDTEEMKLGSVLDATPVSFEQATIRESLPYHRSKEAGGYKVNVPPLTETGRSPGEPPEPPVSFIDRAKKAGLNLYVFSREEQEQLRRYYYRERHHSGGFAADRVREVLWRYLEESADGESAD